MILGSKVYYYCEGCELRVFIWYRWYNSVYFVLFSSYLKNWYFILNFLIYILLIKIM